MPTNEKSEKVKIGTVIIPDHSNGPKSLTWPNGCHCHCAILPGEEHVHRGLGGWWKNDDCDICKPKLAEAKKLIEELPSIVEKLYPQKDMAGMVFLLTEAVRAQDLISYERGREEQRKIDAEIAKEICSDSDCCGPEIYQKIINPSPDAK